MKKQIVLATTFALVLSSLYCPESQAAGETKIVKNQINFNGRKDSQAQS